MDTKKPEPLETIPVRQRCPVCDKTVYSATGIHPQCAMSRAAAVADLAVARRQIVVAAKKQPERSWSKKCPKCRRELHVRRAVCDCGHSFLGARPK